MVVCTMSLEQCTFIKILIETLINLDSDILSNTTSTQLNPVVCKTYYTLAV